MYDDDDDQARDQNRCSAEHPEPGTFVQARQSQRRAVRARTRKQGCRAQQAVKASAREATLMRRSARQRVGDAHEQQALVLLQAGGCVILARQLQCVAGEIDLVVRDADTLVFVEVRARASSRFGGAAASVGPGKQRRLILAARWCLASLTHRYFGGIAPPCRFDVVAFEPSGVRWYRDAMRPVQDK